MSAETARHVPHDPARRGRRGPSRGDVKEAEILDAARRMIAEGRWPEVTVEQLANAVGMSRSTFYFYFESRDAVLRALGIETGRQVRELIAQIGRARDVPVHQLVRQSNENFVRRWETNGPFLRALLHVYETDPELREIADATVTDVAESIATLIEAERAAGRAPPGPPAAIDLAHSFIAMVWRSGYDLSMGAAWIKSVDHLVDVLTDVMIRSIYGTVDEAPRVD